MRLWSLLVLLCLVQPALAQERLSGNVVESFVPNPKVNSSGGLIVGAAIAGTSIADVPFAFDALRVAVPRSSAALPGCLYATSRDGRYSAESTRLEVGTGASGIIPLQIDGFGSVKKDETFPSYPRDEIAAVLRLGGPCSGPDIAPIYPISWNNEPREALHIALNSGGASIRALRLEIGDQVFDGACDSDDQSRSVGFDQVCTISLPAQSNDAECAKLAIKYRPRGVFTSSGETHDIVVAVPPSTGCRGTPPAAE